MPKAGSRMEYKSHLGILEACLLIQSIIYGGNAVSLGIFHPNQVFPPFPCLFLQMRPPLLSLLQLAAAFTKSLQLCPTLCDPIDGRPPGSSIPGILQARTLEWVATRENEKPGSSGLVVTDYKLVPTMTNVPSEIPQKNCTPDNHIQAA